MITKAQEARALMDAYKAEKSKQWDTESFSRIMFLIEQKATDGQCQINLSNSLSSGVQQMLKTAGFTYKEKFDSQGAEITINWLENNS